MSALLGKFPVEREPAVRVYASRGGVELAVDIYGITLQPIEARAMAHAIIAASEEVERMRASKETP